MALVGYTNAGKSTILNRMLEMFGMDDEKRVLEKDMLFATLDTSVRRINTGNNKDFLLSDTVGFIHKLPHGLVKAFRSTLLEVKNADLLLQVVDYSDTHYQKHMETTAETLNELGAGNIPMITVFNKTDKLEEKPPYPRSVRDKIYISAKEDSSVSMLADMILEKTYADFQEMCLLIPYEKGSVVSYFMENTHVISVEYEKEGTRLRVMCHPGDKEKYGCYEDGKA